MAERKVHVDDESCWCEPFMYYRSAVTAREVWVHRTARRISSAGFHMGLMKDPPPEVLSEAVRLADGDADETLADILGALRARRFTFASEAELQCEVLSVLLELPCATGLHRFNEVSIDGAGRIDFLLRGVGIECKVAGSVASITEQLLRYLESDEVEVLLLVTTKRAHRVLAGEHLGKSIRVLVLTGGL